MMFGDIRQISSRVNNHVDEEDNKDTICIEETTVNLNCMKKELHEEGNDFEDISCVKRYKMDVEDNFFGESSCKMELTDAGVNLIDFPENVTMTHELIKLENVKEEDKNVDYLFCSKCNENYMDYCLKCSTLSHILNNRPQFTNSQSELNTIPKGILEIRDTSLGKGVFLLKTLPKDVTLGPFEGILGIKSMKGHCWKINNKKVMNSENGNWMKNIGYALNTLFKNLDVHQIEGNLYYKTNREIMEGEELLIYYDDEEIQCMDNSEDCYYTPQIQEKLPTIFACTLCCFGFSLDKCLMEHKRKCPHAEHSGNIKDLELIECRHCNVWLENQEYQIHHIPYCEERFNRMSYDDSQPVYRNELNVEEREGRPNIKEVHEEYKCSQCSYETACKKNLRKHFNTHKERPYQCDICMVKFIQKSHLNVHKKNRHAEIGSANNYQCSECPYQTNYKYHLQAHINKHNGIKPYQCNICMIKFVAKRNLKRHINDKHSENGGVKEFQCSECSFQTNYKHNFQRHLTGHSGIKPFECDICKMKFVTNDDLKAHTKNKHSESGSTKDYQCSECSFQTNYKWNLNIHMNVGHSGIESFECDICKMKFITKIRLERHVKTEHTEKGTTKDYQCSECSFRTDSKQHFESHLNGHKGIEPFQCDICMMTFAKKDNLNVHVKNKHAKNDSAKDYQCSECSYQTNIKHYLVRHSSVHSENKRFQCDICMMKFRQKVQVTRHMKGNHTEAGSWNNYQCSECPYQTTNSKNLKLHLNTHNDNKPFQCDICMMRFSGKGYLKIHVKKKHNDINPS